jgi:hypothetical protein
MRTAIIIVAGFVLWGICLGVAKLTANLSPSAATIATATFIAIWLILAALNMWLGISTAGFTFMQELPIFLLIFLLPAAVAALVKWKFF